MSMGAEERAGLMVWNKALRGDPQALAQVAQVNPSLAAAISGKAPERPSEPEQEPQPDAAIQLADGSQVPVFTPEGMRKWQQWNQTHLAATLESQFAEKFKPALSVAAQLEQHQQAVQQQQQTQQWAASVLSPLTRLPYYEEFKPEIGKAIAALPPNFDGPLDAVVFDTYTRLLTAKTTGLTKTGEAQALASLQQRAAAGTANPSAASASTPPKFRPGVDGFAEALQHYSGGEAR
jgi:hypothetical protein